MLQPLSSLTIHVVTHCGPGIFRWSLSRELMRIWRAHGIAFECAVVHFDNAFGDTIDDVAEVIYDSWLHAAIVIYGQTAAMASGVDPQSAAIRWFDRASGRLTLTGGLHESAEVQDP